MTSAERICPYAATTARSAFSERIGRVDLLGLEDGRAAGDGRLFHRVRMIVVSATGAVWLREQADDFVRRVVQAQERGKRERPGSHHHESHGSPLFRLEFAQ